MNIGSLYTVKKFFWLLFPSKETAARIIQPDHAKGAVAGATADGVAASSNYWSNQYNCEVTYFSPDSYIVFLEEDGTCKKVLTSDGRIGWIRFDESYNDSFEEVKTEP